MRNNESEKFQSEKFVHINYEMANVTWIFFPSFFAHVLHIKRKFFSQYCASLRITCNQVLRVFAYLAQKDNFENFSGTQNLQFRKCVLRCQIYSETGWIIYMDM